jgi:acyl-CoA hydrolase
MEGRTVRDSMVEMTEIVLPEDSNARGAIFGGRVLALVDKCAAVAALRHARAEVTTVSFDSVEFRHTVRLGNILLLHGRLNAAFGSSMEIEVEVRSEDPATGARTLTTRALVTMVALGPDGRPTKVPPLLALDEEDRRRAQEAAARRARRLAER